MDVFVSRSSFICSFTAAIFLPFSSYAVTDVLIDTKTPVVQSALTSPWELEFGMRYWLGSGHYQMSLFNNSAPTQLVSRLTYEGYNTNSAEGFWRLDNINGVFLKGYFGGGSNNDGHLIDQDFPPGIIYSRTSSQQKNGAVNYVSVDLGYNLYSQDSWQVGAFAGYHYWLEHYNSFGCTQTVSGPICVTPIPTNVDALNDNLNWNSLRLGINAAVEVASRVNLMIDAAYTRSYLSANDFHNLRPDIRGIYEDGDGNGVQLDAIINWEASESLTFGVGGRWWHVSTDGFAHFDQTYAGAQPQPITLKQDVYGLLIQTSYKFGDEPFMKSVLQKDSDTRPFDWEGFYIGANIGYGAHPDYVYINPVSLAAQTISASVPILLDVQSAGFLGGGQVGYNWQINRVIWGVESDLDYAHVSGANSVLLENPVEYTTSTSKNIAWLGTVRGRLGKLASESMIVYVTGGAAIGGTELSFDQRSLGSTCFLTGCSSGTQRQTQIGWTAGAGVEYAVSPRATFKADYLYIDLGASNWSNSNYWVSSAFNSNTVRLGVNYRV
ncbi:MAG: outer membrane beta-barrel protein [Legionella sp.]|nr:outer membrane beta-barrel protein [Legionella sp.]